MKKIIFLRPAPYKDKLPKLDLISGFNLIGQKIVDPKILKPSKDTIKKINLINKLFQPAKVYASNSIRSKNTAEIFDKNYKVCNLVNEIKFSLDYPENIDINLLRFNLIQDFVNGKFEDKPKDIIDRMKNFSKEAGEVKDNIICVSNAFIMKLYEIFFRNNRKIKNPHLFLSEYNWKVKPYEFLEGFVVSINSKGDICGVELLKNLC